jgi:GH24 family phage-related lysozyme (muramidase)
LALGALVSLVIARGPTFDSRDDRSKEMREIKASIATKRFAEVPDEIRRMKRLYSDLPVLAKRRAAEADLFEKGIQSR